MPLALALSLLAPCLAVAPARAQSIPAEAKTAVDAEEFREQIRTYVQAHVQRMKDGQPIDVAGARDALVAGTYPNDLSVSYGDVFADELATALAEVANSDREIVRLNAAIVAARVARRTQSTRLVELIANLMDDQSPAVSLWGIQAAAPLLPQQLGNRLSAMNDPLVPAIVSTTQRYQDYGPIAEEAYEALKLNVDARNGPRPSDRIITNAAPAVIPAIHELIGRRNRMYVGGGQPPEPLAEREAMIFLSHPVVWPQLDEQQKTATVQRFADLIQLLSTAIADEQITNRGELIELLKFLGSTMRAISQSATDSRWQAVARAAEPLTGLSNNANPETVQGAVENVLPPIREGFPDLKPIDRLRPVEETAATDQ